MPNIPDSLAIILFIPKKSKIKSIVVVPPEIPAMTPSTINITNAFIFCKGYNKEFLKISPISIIIHHYYKLYNSLF